MRISKRIPNTKQTIHYFNFQENASQSEDNFSPLHLKHLQLLVDASFKNSHIDQKQARKTEKKQQPQTFQRKFLRGFNILCRQSTKKGVSPSKCWYDSYGIYYLDCSPDRAMILLDMGVVLPEMILRYDSDPDTDMVMICIQVRFCSRYR